jgi:hypothetical protein
MQKAYRITLQIPACVLVSATGLVEPTMFPRIGMLPHWGKRKLAGDR